MRVVLNNVLPFRGFVAVNICGVIFARRDSWEALSETLRQKVLRHEAIHTAQGRELLWLGFYLIYLLEWLVRLPRYGSVVAYKMVSFEREAYDHDWQTEYLKIRKHFAQWRK